MVREHHSPICHCVRCQPSLLQRILSLPEGFPRITGVPRHVGLPALDDAPAPSENVPDAVPAAASGPEFEIALLSSADAALHQYIELLGDSTNAILQDLSDRVSRTAAVFDPIAGNTPVALRKYSITHSFIATFSSLLDDCTAKIMQFQSHAAALREGDTSFSYKTSLPQTLPWSTPPPTPVTRRAPNAFADVVTYTTAYPERNTSPTPSTYSSRPPVMCPYVAPRPHFPTSVTYEEHPEDISVRSPQMPIVTVMVPKTRHFRGLLRRKSRAVILAALLKRFREATGHLTEVPDEDVVTPSHG